MKAFITGGTGFIGNNLVRKLISQGNQVGLLVREKSKTWRVSDLYKKIDFLRGDLTNQRDLKKLVQEYNPDFIYHFGTYGTFPASQQNTDTMSSVNVEGTSNLIDAAKKIPIINIGSSSEYGIKNKAMIESDICQPGKGYGKTKLLQTLHCEEKGIPTLRIFSAYGPWDEPVRLIPHLIKAKLNGEELHLRKIVRDYIYVEDILEAVLKATEQYDKIKGEILNIGSGQQYSIENILNKLNKINPRKLEINWDFNPVRIEPKIWVADITKAKKALEWEPKMSFEEGLKRTYEWFEGYLGEKL